MPAPLPTVSNHVSKGQFNGNGNTCTTLKSDIKLSVGRWFKRIGDPVSRDEPLVEIDTDNVTREIRASVTGILSNVLVRDGRPVDYGITNGPGAG